jgi:hypothetical protein
MRSNRVQFHATGGPPLKFFKLFDKNGLTVPEHIVGQPDRHQQ